MADEFTINITEQPLNVVCGLQEAQDGAPGANGITPQLRATGTALEASDDNGGTWAELIDLADHCVTLTGNQSVAGTKTFTGTLALGSTGQASITYDGNLSLNPRVTGSGNLTMSSGNMQIGTTYTNGGRLHVETGAAGTVGVHIRGVAGQSAEFFRIQNSSGTSLFRVLSSGTLSSNSGATFSGTVTTNSLSVTANGSVGTNFSVGGDIDCTNIIATDANLSSSTVGIFTCNSVANFYGDVGFSGSMPIFSTGALFQDTVAFSYPIEVQSDSGFYGPATFFSSVVMSDQLELNGQVAQSNNSAMTRSLSLKEQMFSAAFLRHCVPSAFNNSGTGTSAINEGDVFSLASGTTASAWQRAGISRVINTNPGATGGNNRVDQAVAFSVPGFYYIDTSGNSEIYFICGDAGSGAPAAIGANKLTGRGFGARIYYSTVNARREIKLFAHNGTTYVESATGAAFKATGVGATQSIIISSDGAGTIKLFYDGAIGDGQTFSRPDSINPYLSLSGGPTGANTYAGPYFSVLTVNGATPPVGQSQAKGVNAMIHVGTVY